MDRFKCKIQSDQEKHQKEMNNSQKCERSLLNSGEARIGMELFGVVE